MKYLICLFMLLAPCVAWGDVIYPEVYYSSAPIPTLYYQDELRSIDDYMENGYGEYCVLWTVCETVPTGCPDYKPDPYTGEYPSTHCAVYHYKIITKSMKHFFPTEKEAREFIANAPDYMRPGMELRHIVNGTIEVLGDTE